MRIAINTRFLLKDKLEGIGVYSMEISQRLARMYPEHQWFFLFDRPFDESFITSKNIIPVVLPPPARHPFLWYWWFEKSIPPFLIKHKIDLFFSPDSFLSLSAKIPQLFTVHDIAYEYFPRSIPWIVNRYYRHYIPLFCKKASNIITISNHTRNDLLKLYQIPNEKITVIPNGVSDLFRPLSTEEIIPVKKQFSDGLPYFLYVGSVHPRKNILSILQAFELLKTKHNSLSHQLVIAGRKAWGNDELFRYLRKMSYQSQVHWYENETHETIAKLYAGATALIYPSMYEGFGLPVLESIACGVPVITSIDSPMSEIASDCGIMINPHNYQEIYQAMLQFATNDTLHAKYALICLERASQYHWEKSANEIAQVIFKLL